VYTDFFDELGPSREVTLPGFAPGTDLERFREKARMYPSVRMCQLSRRCILWKRVEGIGA